jgi:hypothetical protein
VFVLCERWLLRSSQLLLLSILFVTLLYTVDDRICRPEQHDFSTTDSSCSKHSTLYHLHAVPFSSFVGPLAGDSSAVNIEDVLEFFRGSVQGIYLGSLTQINHVFSLDVPSFFCLVSSQMCPRPTLHHEGTVPGPN